MLPPCPQAQGQCLDWKRPFPVTHKPSCPHCPASASTGASSDSPTLGPPRGKMTPTKACYNLALWPFWGTKMENDAISISQVASYFHCLAIACNSKPGTGSQLTSASLCPTLDEKYKACACYHLAPRPKGSVLIGKCLFQSHTNHPAPTALPQQALEPAQTHQPWGPLGGK